VARKTHIAGHCRPSQDHRRTPDQDWPLAASSQCGPPGAGTEDFQCNQSTGASRAAAAHFLPDPRKWWLKNKLWSDITRIIRAYGKNNSFLSIHIDSKNYF